MAEQQSGWQREKKLVLRAGIVILLLGIAAMLVPTVVGLSVGILIGCLVLFAGLVRIYWALQVATHDRAGLLVLGALTSIAGVAIIAHPTFASGALTLILTLYFLFDGVAEIIVAQLLRPALGWGWLMFGGIGSVILGLLLWSQFPFSGAWAVGVLLGIKLLLIGGIMVATGLMPHSDHRP